MLASKAARKRLASAHQLIEEASRQSVAQTPAEVMADHSFARGVARLCLSRWGRARLRAARWLSRRLVAAVAPHGTDLTEPEWPTLPWRGIEPDPVALQIDDLRAYIGTPAGRREYLEYRQRVLPAEGGERLSTLEYLRRTAQQPSDGGELGRQWRVCLRQIGEMMERQEPGAASDQIDG